MAGNSYKLDTNDNSNRLLELDKFNMEIRRIEAHKLNRLSEIIDSTKDWRRLLEELSPVGKDNLDNPVYKYVTGLYLTHEATDKIGRQDSPTLALLNHWAITGRRRPTVGCLLFYLHACNLKWAEDYVCQKILGIEDIEKLLPKPKIKHEPNLIQLIQSPQLKQELNLDEQYKFDDLNEFVRELDSNCTRYSFNEIYELTNKFCHRPYDRRENIGFKIGEGRFGSVYRAKIKSQFVSIDGDYQTTTQFVAAKLLKSDCNKKYLINEINLIGKVKHENILELLGIAFGGGSEGNTQSDDNRIDNNSKYICLIYPYMENGSLLDCLRNGLLTRNMQYINCDDRINILIKIARGITYLHSLSIIHRDIKTANILIDENIQPKVGDFTLIRQMDTVRATETQFSQNIIGTSVYMPPEAFRGDISKKFDTFSFGIVLLELLTGMKPFNEEEDEDLFTYINEKLSDIDDNFAEQTNLNKDQQMSLEEMRDQFLMKILDKKAGDWNFDSCKALFKISLQATESRKKDRPEMTTLLVSLESIASSSSCK